MSAPVRILDTSLAQVIELDCYTSLYYTRGWNSPGQWEMKLNWNMVDDMGNRYASYFQRGYFILVGNDYKKIGIIQEISKAIGQGGKQDEWVTIKGREATAILSRRIVEPPAGSANYTQTAVAETVMKNVVKAQAESTAVANRQISILNVIATTGLGPAYTYSSRYGVLSEDLTAISVATAVGWRITLNKSTTKLDFDCAVGVNRTAGQSTNNRMIISTDYDTLKTGSIVDSEIIYKNIIYGAGQGVGDARNIRKIYTTSEPTGIERRETFADMRDLQANADIDARGANVLAANLFTTFVDASVLSYTQYVIGTDYDLGDYITISAYNTSTDVQITAIKESWAPASYNIDITFNRSYPELPAQIRSNNQNIGLALQNSDGVMVSSGSNANGNWIQFSDGTMEQWAISAETLTPVILGVGGLYYAISAVCTFPLPFVGAMPIVTYHGYAPVNYFSWLGVQGTPSLTQTSQVACLSFNNTATSRYYYRAIGKWK